MTTNKREKGGKIETKDEVFTREKVTLLLTIVLLVTSCLASLPLVASVQPPIDTSTYYMGTVGQPARLDPMRAYDTASGEILQNVYQTLIWYGDKHPVPFSSTVHSYNLTDADYGDLTLASMVPVIATALPTIVKNSTGMYWTFTINPNVVFQTWKDHTGATVPVRNITVDDVVYSFQRQMVYDSYYAPTWMWEQAAYMLMTLDGYTEAEMASMITEWCHAGPAANQVSFHWQPNASDLTQQWPTDAIAQMFTQTWGSIVNKPFCIEHGCWDGLWTLGWQANYWRKPDATRSPLDRFYAATSLYGGVWSVPDACGTGPYEYMHPTSTSGGGWDSLRKVWRLDAFHDYWQNTWDGVNNKWVNGNHVTAIIEKGIDTWPTRKVLFLLGEFDTAVVPRANMFDLLSDKYTPIGGLNLVTNIKSLSNDMLFFTTNVSSSSSYQSYVGYPTHLTGPLPYFFADQHMRRAFAWAMNYTQLIEQAWFGEAIQKASWWVDGLLPANANDSFITLRNLATTMMENELKLAVIDGYNITETGFETTMVYNSGNDQRMIAMQLIANAFASLGPKYRVNVVALDWPVFLDQMYSYALPGYINGWLADFADPENFARAYQHSAGSFLAYQGPPFPDDQDICDEEIDAAILAKTDAERVSLYHDLEQRYWSDCLSVALVQPVGRRFARDWVQGWYYNDLLPGIYAYDLYKSPPDPVDLDVTGTITPITTYPKVYISKGQMKVLYGGGVLATMTFTVHVRRLDNDLNYPSVKTIVALSRDNLTDLADGWTYPSLQGPAFPSQGYTPTRPYTLIPACHPAYPVSTFVLLAPSPDPGTTVSLEWYENGASIALPANATWQLGALVGVFSDDDQAFDSNLTNNAVTIDPNTYNCTALTNTVEIAYGSSMYDKYFLITGDINGDAVVNILDAIGLANSFGKSLGEPGFNPDADLDQTGAVNILDAILLANNFNKKLTFP